MNLHYWLLFVLVAVMIVTLIVLAILEIVLPSTKAPTIDHIRTALMGLCAAIGAALVLSIA